MGYPIINFIGANFHCLEKQPSCALYQVVSSPPYKHSVKYYPQILVYLRKILTLTADHTPCSLAMIGLWNLKPVFNLRPVCKGRRAVRKPCVRQFVRAMTPGIKGTYVF